jgi:acetolactate synthase-1/2/3 large subunit
LIEAAVGGRGMAAAAGPGGVGEPFAAAVLVEAMAAQGVTVCFTNPGTSEMHLVLALDEAKETNRPELRSVLCLFEGVVTGAADGYARMAARPAMTLLHLGHGLANGLANLHNAKWARSPVVNVVGDHATALRQFHATPAESHGSPYLGDIEGYAAPVSGWVRRCRVADTVLADALDCVAASQSPVGQVATLIVPSDVAWAPPPARLIRRYPQSAPPRIVNAAAVAAAAALLRSGARCLLLIGAEALLGPGLVAAARVGEHCPNASLAINSKLNSARIRRGAGSPDVANLPYYFDDIQAALEAYAPAHVLLAGAVVPYAAFGYPEMAAADFASLLPAAAQVHVLAAPADDAAAALEALAAAVGAPALPASALAPFAPPPVPESDAPLTVRARPGRLSGINVFHSKSVLYGVFVWVRRALNNQKWRFPARAGRQHRPVRGGAAPRRGHRRRRGYHGVRRLRGARRDRRAPRRPRRNRRQHRGGAAAGAGGGGGVPGAAGARAPGGRLGDVHPPGSLVHGQGAAAGGGGALRQPGVRDLRHRARAPRPRAPRRRPHREPGLAGGPAPGLRGARVGPRLRGEPGHHCPGHRGRLSALSVFLCKSVLSGAFVWARRALKHQKRRFPARAGA